MRYSLFIALLALTTGLVSHMTRAEAKNEFIVPATLELQPLQAADHDVRITYVTLVGPSAVNLSDTNGRYMWVLSQVRNLSPHVELIQVAIDFGKEVPVGCERLAPIFVPGQSMFFVAPGEQKSVIWRVRYQCHAPAVPQMIAQRVTVGVTHCDPTTSEPGPITQETPGGVCAENSQPAGFEANLANNAIGVTKPVLVR